MVNFICNERNGKSFLEESADLLTLDTKIISCPGDEGSFYDHIKKNKLNFFQQKPEPAAADFKQKRMTGTSSQSCLFHASLESVTS